MNLFRVICFFIFTHVIISLSAQSIILGIRDNQFARVGFFCKHWVGILEHSAFTTKLKNQVLNGYVGYQGTFKQLEYEGTLYGGVQYNKLYHIYGGMCEGKYKLTSWFFIKVGFRPHYDSSYGYKTAYLGGCEFKLHKEIYLITSYTNYPEYRTCIDRIKGGLSLKVKNLTITPLLSIPIKNNIENIRLSISFKYILLL